MSGISSFDRSSLGPIPESRSILGESMDPADRITSFFASTSMRQSSLVDRSL